MPGDIVIVGIGMMTPLGLDAEQTAASVEAGLSAFDQSSIFDRMLEPVVMGVLPDDVLTELNDDLKDEEFLTSRERRLLRLAQTAIEQATAPLKDEVKGLPLYLGLPEIATPIKLDPKQLLKRLAIQCHDGFDPSTSKAFLLGRGSGLLAVHQAMQVIKQGSVPMALAGGVDRYNDHYVTSIIDDQKRLNTSQRMDGFIPGEGAGFLLLASEDYARSNSLPVIGSIVASGTGEEKGHMYSSEPYRGEGLAMTVQTMLTSTNGRIAEIPTVYSSMNGEDHFAKEWGVTFVRNSKKIKEEFRIEHPADCLGDTGAASGPIMVGLAASAIRTGLVKGPALVYASSDTACRAAVIVTSELEVE